MHEGSGQAVHVTSISLYLYAALCTVFGADATLSSFAKSCALVVRSFYDPFVHRFLDDLTPTFSAYPRFPQPLLRLQLNITNK